MTSGRPTVQLPLNEIRYSQDSINENFSNGRSITTLRNDLVQTYHQSTGGCGESFTETTTERFRNAEKTISEFFFKNNATIIVTEQPQGSGQYYSMDNRRLWCVKSMCSKVKIAESAFKLRVLLDTRQQQQQSSRRPGQLADCDLKLTTVTNGESIIVMRAGRKAQVAEKFGQSAYELVFLPKNDVLFDLFDGDEHFGFIAEFKRKHQIKKMSKELCSFDGQHFYYVSIIADGFHLQRSGIAIYNELEQVGSESKNSRSNVYSSSEMNGSSSTFQEVFRRAQQEQHGNVSSSSRNGSTGLSPTLVDLTLDSPVSKSSSNCRSNVYSSSPGFGRNPIGYQSGLNRNRAPIDSYRREIIKTIRTSNVTIIKSAAGSGKSTRVPLMIRDHHTQQGTHLELKPRILLTQPRRVATISTARRIAQSIGQKLEKEREDDHSKDGAKKPKKTSSKKSIDPDDDLDSREPCEVGYMIRGQSSGQLSDVKIAVCTTGWLLHKMRSEPAFFQNWDYILLDEMHERTVESDFMTLFCKDALLTPLGTGIQRTKVVVMSATVQSEIFEDYFRQPLKRALGNAGLHDDSSDSDVPSDSYRVNPNNLAGSSTPQTNKLVVKVVDVPLPTHKTFVLHLDDLVSPAQFRRNILLEGRFGSSSTTGTNGVCSAHSDTQQSLPLELERTFTALDLGPRAAIAASTMASMKTEERLNRPEVPWEAQSLIEDLIKQFGRSQESILVVMPGLEQIFRLQDHLSWSLPLQDTEWTTSDSYSSTYSSGDVRLPSASSSSTPAGPSASNFEAFVLHSSVPIEDQNHAVQSRIREGYCRIYIASNIAESSLTLPRVRVVIDSGLHRQSEYDPQKRTSALETRWISKASVKQREGRTGREFSGINIRLYTRDFYQDDANMPKFDTPVIKLAPMEQTLLQVLSLSRQSLMFSSLAEPTSSIPTPQQQRRELSAKAVLNALPTPPAQDRIDQTLLSLAGAGAISEPDEKSQVTMLGHAVLLLELEVPLAALVLYFVIWGKPLEGILIAASGACENPLTPEIVGYGTSTKEVTKRNKRLVHVVSHFSKGIACEHVGMRNLLVQLLLDFNDYKNANANWLDPYSGSRVTNRTSSIKNKNTSISTMFGKYLAKTWIPKYSEKINKRRLETIINTARDLSEKVSQNTLDIELGKDLRIIPGIFSPVVLETRELELRFGNTEIEELQGLLLCAFSPSFVTLKSRLLDSDDVLVVPKEVDNGGNNSNALLSSSSTNSGNSTFPTNNNLPLSDITLKERKLVVDLAVKFHDLGGMKDVFVLDSCPPNRPQQGGPSFPIGADFDNLYQDLVEKLQQISKADTAHLESISDKKIGVKFMSENPNEECLTDDEDYVNDQYAKTIKEILLMDERKNLTVADIKNQAKYRDLKKQIGMHTPPNLYEFLDQNGNCLMAFSIMGYGNGATVRLISRNPGQDTVPKRATTMVQSMLKAAADYSLMINGASSGTSNRSYSSRNAPNNASKKFHDPFPPVRSPVTNNTSSGHPSRPTPSQPETFGKLVELYKGRRKELKFDNETDGDSWAHPAVSIANITSPFAFRWLFPNVAPGFFRGSDGKARPAYPNAGLNSFDGNNCTGAGIPGLSVNGSLIPAYPDSKLQLGLIGHYDDIDQLRYDVNFAREIRNLKRSGTDTAEQQAKHEQRFVDVSHPECEDRICFVVGKGGEVIKQLKEISGCEIETPFRKGKGKGKDVNPLKAITISGPPEVLDAAERAVKHLLERKNKDLVLEHLKSATEGYRLSKEGNSLEENPVDVIARRVMRPTAPPQVFAIYQKASLNLDSHKRPISAVLTGTSSLRYDNPNVLALLLLVFGNPRLRMKVLFDESGTFRALQSGCSSIVSNCSLDHNYLKKINMLRLEVSKVFSECLPLNKISHVSAVPSTPEFQKSDNARTLFRDVLRSIKVVGRRDGTISNASGVQVLLDLHTKDPKKILGEWSISQSEA